MEKLGMLRRYIMADFDFLLALTYRPSPAAGFDGREDGLKVATNLNPYIGQTNYSDRVSIKDRAVGFVSLDIYCTIHMYANRSNA